MHFSMLRTCPLKGGTGSRAFRSLAAPLLEHDPPLRQRLDSLLQGALATARGRWWPARRRPAAFPAHLTACACQPGAPASAGLATLARTAAPARMPTSGDGCFSVRMHRS
jgi:hypothetical protein